ncbi:MAG: efflux RND transporter periplasmic adaptor subunit [Desulfosoma sp.]
MSVVDRQRLFTAFSGKFKTVLAFWVTCAVMLPACQDKPSPKVSSSEPVRLSVMTVKQEKIPSTVELSGTVRAAHVSVLSSKVFGRILSIEAREGDRVRKGQVLVRIDDRETRAGVEQAQASLRQAQYALEEAEKALRMAQAEAKAAEARRQVAQATFQRFQALLVRESVSRQEFDEIKARHESAAADAERARQAVHAMQAKREQAFSALRAAKAGLEAAQALWGYAQVTAPMDALVTLKHADVGHMATPGLPLLTVEDFSSYRLEVPVPEEILAIVHIGDIVPVLTELFQGPVQGTVVEVFPSVDPQSRSGIVKIQLPSSSTENKYPPWRTGTFARARFVTGIRETILVPISAVTSRGQLTGVYVVDDNQVCRWRLVRTGQTLENRVEILSGLQDGERIVAQIVPEVKDGTRIIAE